PFYGSYGGVLASDVEAAQALWVSYRDLLAGVGVCAGTVVFNPFCSDPDSHYSAPSGTIDRRRLQINSLDSDIDFPARLLRLVDSSTRRNIRKAQRDGVAVRVDEGKLDFLANCHLANMKRINGRSKPRAFFNSLDHHFCAGRDYRLYVAQIDGEPVSALLLFYYRHYVEYFVPVTVDAHRNSQPMALILYKAMCDAAREGYRIWNWGGTWESQSGVYRFKKKWGAVERSYNYLVNVVDPGFLEYATQDELAASYGNFFVVPFNLLKLEPGAIL
ncbi:MAG TPA: hypothetical protein DGR97_05705, partial [Gammaproteobacteria bacterium]|nr:hypothetical protein [Gammaproteobacteria bacterium]